MILSFGLDVLVEQDLVPHLMQLMENIPVSLENPAEVRKVLKARIKLDSYHQAWLRIRQRISQYEGMLLALKEKFNKLESKKEEVA